MSSGGRGEVGEREGLSFNVRAFRKCLSVFLVNAIIQVLVFSVKAWNQASLILMLCRKLDETLLRKVRSSGDRIFAATLDR